MSGFYPLVLQLHVALSIPKCYRFFLSISLSMYSYVYIKPLYEAMF